MKESRHRKIGNHQIRSHIATSQLASQVVVSPLRVSQADRIEGAADDGDVEIPIVGVSQKCNGLAFSEIFGNAGSLPPWMCDGFGKEESHATLFDDDDNAWN